MLVAAVFGLIEGLVAGYRGGWVDALLMRFADILFAFPAILLAIAIVAALGPRLLERDDGARHRVHPGVCPSGARLSPLSEGARIRLAARASGATRARSSGRHILVNALPPIIVFATLQTGQMIIFGAALSFLGLGVQPPTPDWGTMANDGPQLDAGRAMGDDASGIAIFFVSVGFNLLGDGLRDALDPTLKV